MNEAAVRIEERIISMSAKQEMQVYQGWILKKDEKRLWVYPLYYKSAEENLRERIRACEEIACRSGLSCAFRIAEHTNYYLSAVLEDCGYGIRRCGVVGVCEVGDRRAEQTVVDIPGVEDLPEEYERAGVHRVYSYQIYQKTED